jgi:uncharacterized membrane protein YeiH
MPLPELTNVVTVLGYCGIAVFAVSGALDAARNRMDIMGFMLIGAATGLGGGTLRDLLLGLTPVYWVREPAYIGLCLAVASLTYFVAPHLASRLRALVWMDAIGLALFSVTGTQIALTLDVAPLAAVCMGVITATFGGIIRDVLCAESLVLSGRELYVSTALAGALTLLILTRLRVDNDLALIGGFLVSLALRSASIVFDLRLPSYYQRPPKNS